MTNFQITGAAELQQMIRSIGKVKKASAYCNNQCGFLDDERLKYITEACDEVISGKLDSWFITDCIQGGAGTSFNMNANEVIANRAAQLAGRETASTIYPSERSYQLRSVDQRRLPDCRPFDGAGFGRGAAGRIDRAAAFPA